MSPLDRDRARLNIQLNLDRCLQKAKISAEQARQDPFNGGAVHRAVSEQAYAEGYRDAIGHIFGLLEAMAG